eukprot:gene13466-13244_t
MALFAWRNLGERAPVTGRREPLFVTPPSDTELEILKVFWRDGAASAREIQAALPQALDWTGSTTRTVLERMRAKGLLVRRSVHGLAVYEAAQ